MTEKLERIEEGLDALAAMIVQRERYDDPEARKAALKELLHIVLLEISRLALILKE